MPQPSILPLPDDVVAQIKSSTAINSLSDVVLELLENSLDAKATKIDATVDFARGGCTVEDNGLGIAPSEFQPDGGLGRLYYTSKYQSHDALLGHNGAFLASLSVQSLLTITSHHHEHRSHNTLKLHHGKVIERQLPALEQDEIRSYIHGTSVNVRNLFGNLPVRVKQRAVVVEEKAELDRLWEGLTKDITSLLLSWNQPASVKLRDTDNKTRFNVNSHRVVQSISSQNDSTRSRSTKLRTLLNILTQASYISFDDWESWVPVAASTSSVSIKGAISLEPVPTKDVQFISFAHQPLSSDGSHNELYSAINRIFNLSSFGAVEDEPVIDENEKLRRANDGRYKSDGFTTKQLKGARKGIDRWPMFHFRISFPDQPQRNVGSNQILENTINLQAVTEVLSATVTQWLEVHHFRPRKRRPRIQSSRSPPIPPDNEETSSDSIPGEMSRSEFKRGTQGKLTLGRNSTDPESRKRKRSSSTMSKNLPKQARSQAFATWTRIKSGDSAFFDTVGTFGKEKHDAHVSSSGSRPQVDERKIEAASTSQDLNNSARLDTSDFTVDHEASHGHEYDVCSTEPGHDDIVIWTDPSTNQTFLLNARTGSVMPHIPERLQSGSSLPSTLSTLTDCTKSLRLQKKRSSSEELNTPWLNEILQTWRNPVFNPAGPRIQQIVYDDAASDPETKHHSHHLSCCRFDVGKEFVQASLFKQSRLSKEGLRDAKVIAQLDKKFILVKMRDSSLPSMDVTSNTELLVLIDQHAADERIRVEALFAELCTSASTDPKAPKHRSKLGRESSISVCMLETPIKFTIGKRECTMFRRLADYLATWGILYNITPKSSQDQRKSTAESILSVSTLPPVIAERCKSDPKLLLSLMRFSVFNKWGERRPLASIPNSESSSLEGAATPAWIRKIANCPDKLIELVNSRACRSAVMFNDELSMEECKRLVGDLAKCVFPFKCAHWRPSMVPLVDLGVKNHDGIGEDFGNAREDGVFGFGGDGVLLDKASTVDGWRIWMKGRERRKG